MPEGRTTQTYTEAVAEVDAGLRVTQTYAEAVAQHDVGEMRATQLYVEVVAEVFNGWPFPTGPILVGLPNLSGRPSRGRRDDSATNILPAIAEAYTAASPYQEEILIADPELPPAPADEPPALEPPPTPSAGGPPKTPPGQSKEKPVPPGQAKEKPVPPGQAKGRGR